MDARFPTYYITDRRILRLSPEQFRFFVIATTWSVSNKTDGHISTEDLELIPFVNHEYPAALVRSGLWKSTESGWLIAEFEQTQTSAAQMEAAMENRLAKDRERQKRARVARKEASRSESMDASRDDHVSFGRQGRGKAEEEEEALYKEPDLSEAEKDEAWAVGREPSMERADACITPGCSGRLTESNLKRGVRKCLECVRLSGQTTVPAQDRVGAIL
ncbi:hypothetical protein J2S92_003339 [Arthrobacter bambusae]|nr:hypothetical protein [Arthrobacter bambusae]MDQ0237074.1 hypothetical protein [Arthrobacter bambusae]